MKSDILCALTRDGVTFTMETKLTKKAVDKETMDVWQCVISCDYPGVMETEYRTGIGHRKGYKPRMSSFDMAKSQPQHPDIASVLSCLGSDYNTARDMPLDDVAAMDHLQDEFGHEGKASELLKLVRALRKIHDDIRSLLKHTGIDADHFADWCADLDR